MSKTSFHYSLIHFCQENKLTLIEEYRFDPTRRWRSDYFIPELNCLLEYEGMVHNGKGGHQTKVGFANNCEKYNKACVMGFRLLRYTALNWKDCLRDLELIKNEHGT